MDKMVITVVAEMDIHKDSLVWGSTEFVFFKEDDNAIDYALDEYFNSADWEQAVFEEGENKYQRIFSFRSRKQPDNSKMLIVETVKMDEREIEMLSDLIEFSD